jgi:hypothetical protein
MSGLALAALLAANANTTSYVLRNALPPEERAVFDRLRFGPIIEGSGLDDVGTPSQIFGDEYRVSMTRHEREWHLSVNNPFIVLHIRISHSGSLTHFVFQDGLPGMVSRRPEEAVRAFRQAARLDTMQWRPVVSEHFDTYFERDLPVYEGITVDGHVSMSYMVRQGVVVGALREGRRMPVERKVVTPDTLARARQLADDHLRSLPLIGWYVVGTDVLRYASLSEESPRCRLMVSATIFRHTEEAKAVLSAQRLLDLQTGALLEDRQPPPLETTAPMHRLGWSGGSWHMDNASGFVSEVNVEEPEAFAESSRYPVTLWRDDQIVYARYLPGAQLLYAEPFFGRPGDQLRAAIEAKLSVR